MMHSESSKDIAFPIIVEPFCVGFGVTVTHNDYKALPFLSVLLVGKKYTNRTLVSPDQVTRF